MYQNLLVAHVHSYCFVLDCDLFVAVDNMMGQGCSSHFQGHLCKIRGDVELIWSLLHFNPFSPNSPN